MCSVHCHLIAVPQALHSGILAPPNTAGRLLASPTFPTRIFLGPVGTGGCHEPGLGAGAEGAGAGCETGDLEARKKQCLGYFISQNTTLQIIFPS